MNYKMTKSFFRSSNGVNNIAYYDYKPLQTPRAVVQIAHGMTETIPKYEHFIDFLAGKGIAVVAHDHLGHGSSVINSEDFGFFADKDGYKRLVDDMRTVTMKASELYPGLPLVMFAHSMGSFVARLYMTQHAGESLYPNAVILCGTSGPVRAIALGIAEASHIAEKKGERYRSKKLAGRISAGRKKYPHLNQTAYSWLTRDEKVIEQRLNEESISFIFTASGFRDLFTMLKLVSEPEWYQMVPKNLPVYIISGEHDPIGQFGRGVNKVYKSLKDAGVSGAKLGLYPECRHELINELNKDEIFNDILSFIEDKLEL